MTSTDNLSPMRASARWLALGVALAVMMARPERSTAAEVRPEVLVYYANETAAEGLEASNYDTIIEWLGTGNRPEHARIAQSLQRDRRTFAAVVDVEVDTLLNEIPQLRGGPQALLVTNRLARRSKCLIWRRGWEQFREVDFHVSLDDNYILAANPLSRPATLRDTLAFVAKEFSPSEYDFVLITKSHGSDRTAITPRLVVRAEETNREELVRVATGELGDDELPSWTHTLGISKVEYFAILEELGYRLQMHFSLIYLEACKACTPSLQPDQLPGNVDRLLRIRYDAHYQNLFYADVLKGLHDDRLSDGLTRNLPAKFVLLDRNLKRTQLWIYFIPLALWIGWMIREWNRKMRTSRGAI